MSTRIAVLSLVFLACRSLLPAQVISGTLEGAVYDPNGGLIPAAQVGIRNTDTGLSRITASSGAGAFRFDQLEIGPYRVTVTAPGFKRFETVVQVSLGNMAAVRADMQVGDTSQSVEVQASAATVEVNTAEVARSVGSNEMLDIPVLSRNPADLLQLAPGVPAITQDKNGSLTVGGLRPRSTTYNVDGASNNFEVSSGPRTPVILEAVEEVRAVTNVFSAQYGKGSGAVVDMVMKSGTNKFHGNLFAYHRNRSLDATPFFNNATSTGKPAFILNIYGATIGGPVIRDRTFFFGAYQGTNLRTQGLERLNVVPDSLRTALTGDTRSLSGDPVVGGLIRDVFARMPSCQSAGAICVYNSNQSRPQDESIGNLKVDHRFNDNNLLSMRYLIRDYSQTAQSAMGGVANLSTNRDSNLALTYRKVFSPRVLNEVVFARSTFERAVRVPESTLPDVGIQGYTSIGNSSNLPQEFTNTYYQVLDNFSLMIGKHNIRAGMDALWNTSSGYALFQGRGIYSFQGLPADFGAADGLTNFRLGRSASFQASRGDFQRRFDNWDLSFYGQDDWRISSRLTLNLGIRYELQLPPTVTAVKTGQQVFEAFDPTTFRFARWKSDRNNFSPSVGVAWDPTGKGRYSIRAGYRLAYDRIVQDFYNVGAIIQAPFIESFAVQIPQIPAIPLGRGVDVARSAGVPINTMLTPDVKLGYAHSWHFSTQARVSRNSSLEVGYLGTAGRALPMVVASNRINPATRTRPNTQFGQVAAIESIAYSNYHGLLSKYQLRVGKGLTLTASYTFSKALDLIHDAIATFGGAPTTATVAAEPGTQRPVLGLEYGLAVFDRPHAFSSGFVYRTPKVGGNAVLGALVGQWSLGGLALLQSGNPFSLAAGVDLNQDGLTNDRPDLLDTSILGRTFNNPDGVIPREAFNIATTPVRVGNLGRNVVRRDYLRNLDLSLARRFPLGERATIDFRGEFFNITNTTRFAAPVNTVAAANFGRIQSQENNPRFVRLGLRLVF